MQGMRSFVRAAATEKAAAEVQTHVVYAAAIVTCGDTLGRRRNRLLMVAIEANGASTGRMASCCNTCRLRRGVEEHIN